jgi:hypothetical protein
MRYLPVLVLVALIGCTPPSMNLQRAGLRSACDSGVTAALDAVSDENLDSVQKDIKDTCDALSKFMADGHVADLVYSDFRADVEKLIPTKMKPYFDAILTAVSTQDLNVDKIGANNVKRINAAIFGVQLANTQYAKSDRPVKQ